MTSYTTPSSIRCQYWGVWKCYTTRLRCDTGRFDSIASHAPHFSPHPIYLSAHSDLYLPYCLRLPPSWLHPASPSPPPPPSSISTPFHSPPILNCNLWKKGAATHHHSWLLHLAGSVDPASLWTQIQGIVMAHLRDWIWVAATPPTTKHKAWQHYSHCLPPVRNNKKSGLKVVF